MKKFSLFFAIFMLMAASGKAATYTVHNDSTLRAAINTINSRTGGDTIRFSGNTITLQDDLPEITKSCSIIGNVDGQGKPITTIDGGGGYETFYTSSSSSNNYTFKNLIITGSSSSGILVYSGRATITNTTCNENSSNGIYVIYGDAVITNTTCSGNNAGIFVSGSAVITNTTCSGNNAGINVDISGYATIASTTCNGNRYGIFVSGYATIASTTCSGNSDFGIYLSGIASVYNSISYGNTGQQDFYKYSSGTLNIYNSAYGTSSGTITQSNCVQIDGTSKTLTLTPHTNGTLKATSTGFDITKLADSTGLRAVLTGAGMTASQADSAVRFDQLGIARTFTGAKYTAGAINEGSGSGGTPTSTYAEADKNTLRAFLRQGTNYAKLGLAVSDTTTWTTSEAWVSKVAGLTWNSGNPKKITAIEWDYKQLAGSLDLSGCTALIDLNCYDNQLTILDVTKNTALTKLYCNSNQLTSLDVSKNTALTVLNCDFNRLTSLDVTKNTELEGLFCFENNLSSLDVSKNTALTVLYCSDNQLTSLDVTKNTELEGLFCFENNLSSLDVSKNTKLDYLDCSDNQLKFSTTPLPKSQYTVGYYYAPQDTIHGGEVAYTAGVDLSSEYKIDGITTVYKWYDITSGKQAITLTDSLGHFKLTSAYAGKKLLCEMTNAKFPDFKGDDVLKYEVTILQGGADTTSTYTITALTDDGTGSLRETINKINNSTATAPTIKFADNLSGEIKLASALPAITKNVHIIGNKASTGSATGQPTITINGDKKVEDILVVTAGITATIENLHITNAKTSGVSVYGTDANAIITNCAFTNNESYGILVTTKANAIITNCIASKNGDGVQVFNEATASVNNSTMSQNTRNGIGIYMSSSAVISGCTMSNNSAYGVDAFQASAKTTIYNSIFYGNTDKNTLNSDVVNVYNCVYDGTETTPMGNITTADCKDTDPKLAANTVFNVTGYYTLQTGSSALSLADKSHITVDKLKPVNNSFYNANINANYISKVLNNDQLGAARTFFDSKYAAGSINSTEKGEEPNPDTSKPFVVTTSDDNAKNPPAGSLRWVINNVNAHPADTMPKVTFKDNVKTINLAASLPYIAKKCIITGNVDANGRPTVLINGQRSKGAGTGCYALVTDNADIDTLIIENVNVVNSRGNGIGAGNNGLFIVRNVVSKGNEFAGIYAGKGRTIIDNVICNGNRVGIEIGDRAVIAISNAACNGNANTGVEVGGWSKAVMANVTAIGNSPSWGAASACGIYTYNSPAVVVNSTCTWNGSGGIVNDATLGKALITYNSVSYGNKSYDFKGKSGTVGAYNSLYVVKTTAVKDVTGSIETTEAALNMQYYKEDGSVWVDGTDSLITLVYAKPQSTSSAYGVADANLITIANLTQIVTGDTLNMLKSLITQEWIDKAVNYDQLGYTRSKASSKYCAGAVDGKGTKTDPEPQPTSVFMVTNSSDNGTSPAEGSLRWAINKVNTYTGTATPTIKFADNLTGGNTIKLTTYETPIEKNCIVLGKKGENNPIIIDGDRYNSLANCISINNNANVQLENLYLTNGTRGIVVSGGSKAIIINTKCIDNELHGISVDGDNCTATIINTTCSENGQLGIGVFGDNNTATIINTTCVKQKPHSGGIESRTAIIYNSIVYENMRGYNAPCDLVLSGAIYNTAYGVVGAGSPTLTNCVKVDGTSKKLTLTPYTNGTYKPTSTGFDITKLADSTGLKAILIAAGLSSAKADSVIKYDQLGNARTFTNGKYTAGSIESSNGSTEHKLAKPTLIAPANNGTNAPVLPTFTWNMVDSVNKFVVEYSTSNTFASVFSFEVQDLSYTLTTELSYNATYYWRVKAVNAYTSSEWSNIWSFKTIENSDVLTAPVLVSPANNASSYVTNPTFVWNKVSHATNYMIEYSENSSFNNAEMYAIPTTQLKVPDLLLHNTKYYWRAKAMNGNTESAWSEVHSFTTAKEVSDIYPPNGNDTVDADKDTEISWPPTPTSADTTVDYNIRISKSQIFPEEVTISYYASIPALKITTKLEPNTVYFWQYRDHKTAVVKPKFGNTLLASETYGPWSEVYSFKTAKSTGIEDSRFVYTLDVLPNPAHNEAELHFSMLNNAKVAISIHNALGHEMQRVEGMYEMGNHSIKLNISDFVSGNYVCRIMSNGNIIATANFVVVK